MSSNLAEALRNSIHHDAQIRRRSEAFLLNAEKKDRHTVELLQLVACNSQDDLKLCAAIRFKNVIEKYYPAKEPPESEVIKEPDRVILRANIFKCMIGTGNLKLINILIQAAKFIVRKDFPQQFPNLLSDVVQGLKSERPEHLYSALSILYVINNRYSLRQMFSDDDPRREQAKTIMTETLPPMLVVFKKLGQVNEPSTIQLHLTRLLLKNIYVATASDLPEIFLGYPTVFNEWLIEIHKHMRCWRPADLPDEDDERENHQSGKVQKWACRACNRFFMVFGRPNHLQNDFKSNVAHQQFASTFITTHAPATLGKFFEILKYKSTGGFVSRKVTHVAYKHILNAVCYGQLFSKMEPHLDFLMFECIVPTLSLQKADVKLWQEEPEEFIRKNTDFLEQFNSPEYSASQLLLELVKVRTRYTLRRVLNWISTNLQRFKEAGKNLSADTFVRKDCATNLFGLIYVVLSTIMHSKDFDMDGLTPASVKASVKSILNDHVIPDLWSTIGFLQKRSLWCIAKYKRYLDLTPEKAEAFINQLVNMLSSPELPCRMEAARTVMQLLSEQTPIVPLFRKYLAKVLDNLFRLTQELGSAEVVETFERILLSFQEDVAPYALILVDRLKEEFNKVFIAKESAPGEQQHELIGTLLSIIKLFGTLVDSCCVHAELLGEIEKRLLPWIQKYFVEKDYGFAEEMISLLGEMSMTDEKREITDLTWGLSKTLIHGSLNFKWLQTFDHEVLSVLSNFLFYGRDKFANDSERLVGSIRVALKCMENASEYCLQPVCSFYDSLFTNLRGQLGAGYEELLGSVVKRLQLEAKQEDPDENLGYLTSTLSCALYYSPRAFVGLGMKQKWLEDVMKMLFATDKIDWVTKKHIVFGLCALIAEDPSHLPQELKAPNFISQVLRKITDLILDMNEVETSGEEEEDTGVAEMNPGGDQLDNKELEEMGNQGADAMDGNEPAVFGRAADDFQLRDCEKSTDYVDPLAGYGMAFGLDHILYGDYEEGEYDFGFDLEDNLTLTILMKQDENVMFRDSLIALQTQQPGKAEQWRSSLSQEEKVVLGKHLKQAHKALHSMNIRDADKKAKAHAKAQAIKLKLEQGT